MKTICVYAGSNPGNSTEYERYAVMLGELLVEKGYKLVYGGSKIGLMGRLADTVLAGGGEAVGVMPRGLFRGEMVHARLTELIEVDSMHERKAKMQELADGFVALPGGFGTLEELFEAVSWSQLGIHAKPVGLLDVEGYYAPLVRFVSHAVDAGFIHSAHAGLLLLEREPANLLERMESFRPPQNVNKWSELPVSK
ncbi:TIGR00730 family Rossman fold protein [Paenibacillus sp. MBLB4367]|uniref:LOG family protein n=1 Tax=Paenibacillus sp. MBLB4367 TaxID=3384767 RepID=UPI0039083C36